MPFEVERDKDGFVSQAALAKMAKLLGEEEFVRACPSPVLLTTAILRDGVSADWELTPGSGVRVASIRRTLLATAAELAAEAARTSPYRERAAVLTKRPGASASEPVTLGRAMTNDVVYLLDTVSKHHGIVVREGETWFFTDQRSSNGTKVNGEPLPAGEKRALRDADTIALGTNIETVFLRPKALRARLLAL